MRPLPSPLLVVTDRASLTPPRSPVVGLSIGNTAGMARGSPDLPGEGQGEVRAVSEQVPHLTPTLSVQERKSGALGADSPAVHVMGGVPARGADDLCGEGLALVARIDELLTGGARWVWFRERDMAQGPREKLARAVLERVRARGGVLCIGGDAAIAASLGADGVHLPGGATAADFTEARRRLPGGLIGISAHTLGEVAAAARQGADYATLSPIFATASKPGYGPALGPAALRAAASHGLPVIALGGVTGETTRTCRDAGAAGIAVMGGLMRGLDPARDAGALLDAWGP